MELHLQKILSFFLFLMEIPPFLLIPLHIQGLSEVGRKGCRRPHNFVRPQISSRGTLKCKYNIVRPRNIDEVEAIYERLVYIHEEEGI